jgi:hypothetical protein
VHEADLVGAQIGEHVAGVGAQIGELNPLLELEWAGGWTVRMPGLKV